ncbi:hypothetical protein GQX73_g7517 [Xylaria multiplex]|uniref:Uncharacterized protein n=1 Tax=Xylaria multiplex TaxID=323545 RepID=A0A7C8IXI0_9PEZI|nr:hypothetical protein GQX73_g7517 [Xylaria multiplex]
MASMEVQLGPTSGPTSRVDSSAAVDPRYHHHYDLHHPHLQNSYYGYNSPMPQMRKRKAESQDNNERLSKRLSLLNLEKNGHKLYVPVETPSLQPLPKHPAYSNHIESSSSSAINTDDTMQLDNTKHKVYIYDLDAELSSADENSESESSLPGSPTSGRGRLVFLPDIKKHLSRTRIPPAVLANQDGELAGHNINDMQMVLYNEPSSLTVPREQDSVRKAILEARARMRQRQRDGQAETEQEQEQEPHQPGMPTFVAPYATSSLQDLRYANGINVAMNGFIDHDLSRNTLVVDDDAMDMD